MHTSRMNFLRIKARGALNDYELLNSSKSILIVNNGFVAGHGRASQCEASPSREWRAPDNGESVADLSSHWKLQEPCLHLSSTPRMALFSFLYIGC